MDRRDIKSQIDLEERLTRKGRAPGMSAPASPVSHLIILSVVVFLSGLLFILRFFLNISFSEPLHLTTSGGEETSLFSLWRFVHGLPVYVDPYKIPYSIAYLNWLFYGVYGMLMRGAMFITGASDAWIPTIGRLISVGFSAAGFFVTRKTLQELIPSASRNVKVLLSLVSFYLFFGPLAAFWPLTNRPDIAASVLELLAFYFFVKLYRTSFLRAALTAGILTFAGWSFKQVNISVFLSLVIFCLIHNQRRAALLLSSIFTGLCAIVFWIGGYPYWESTVAIQPQPGFSLIQGATIFVYYVLHCAFAGPGYVALGASFYSQAVKDRIRENKPYQLCLIVALVSSLLGCLTSMKIAGAENYFIPASIFVTLFCVLYLADLEPYAESKIFRACLWASLTANAMIILLTLFSVIGNVSKKDDHRDALALLKCAETLPRPIFSQAIYLGLPWMLGGESFVTATYWIKEERKRNERGGIAGLIREGYFASLILKKSRIYEIFMGESVNVDEELKNYSVQESLNCPSAYVALKRK